MQSLCPVGCLSLNEESLVSSNLNSKLFQLHSAHSNLHILYFDITVVDLPVAHSTYDKLLAIPTGEDLYFLDTPSNTIYELNLDLLFGGPWDQLSQNMTTPSTAYTMMWIPESLASCT